LRQGGVAHHPTSPLAKSIGQTIFGGFAGLARPLNSNVHRPASKPAGPKKGRLEMSGQTTITRTLIAALGALLMSSVAVGSAIAPAHVAIAQTQSSINA
jgi:hypothetical protein